MASLSIENQRENAEIYHGHSICKKKSIEVLEELNLPKGLLPLEDVIEVGYNRATGFVWLKQKKKKEHRFTKINRLVSYEPEVTAYVEDRRMKKMSGVKTRELMLWISLTEMYIDDPASGKINFKTSTGLGRTFPVSAFEIEEAGEN